MGLSRANDTPSVLRGTRFISVPLILRGSDYLVINVPHCSAGMPTPCAPAAAGRPEYTSHSKRRFSHWFYKLDSFEVFWSDLHTVQSHDPGDMLLYFFFIFKEIYLLRICLPKKNNAVIFARLEAPSAGWMQLKGDVKFKTNNILHKIVNYHQHTIEIPFFGGALTQKESDVLLFPFQMEH